MILEDSSHFISQRVDLPILHPFIHSTKSSQAHHEARPRLSSQCWGTQPHKTHNLASSDHSPMMPFLLPHPVFPLPSLYSLGSPKSNTLIVPSASLFFYLWELILHSASPFPHNPCALPMAKKANLSRTRKNMAICKLHERPLESSTGGY